MARHLRAALLLATALVGGTASAAPLITGAVSDAARVAMAGEMPALLRRAADLGALAASTPLDHVQLVLRRAPERQAAFDALVAGQQNAASPVYHRWLTADGLRAYGPDPEDVATVVRWLQARGLRVNAVSPSGMSIDFAGTAAQVAAAFGTSLHTVSVPGGALHIAPLTDPSIPAALAPVVHGPVLSNFFPRPNMVRATRPVTAGRAAPRFDVGGYEAVGPQDFNTIYNVTPLLRGTSGAALTGAGVTVAVLEQTDIQPEDFHRFRNAFGLKDTAGRFIAAHPFCTDPGTTADEGEAALDAEWIGVAAPDADVVEASCTSTSLTFGVESALSGVVEHASAASVLSISYGGPEQENSAAFLAGWSNLLEEAAAEGKSVFISSGDSGSSYDRGAIATDGLAVNGLSSNPYNTTVGGTDFLDTYRGTSTLYWTATNKAGRRSARSYIPETPWDNSCAGGLIKKYGHYANAIATCNDPSSPYFFQQGTGGSGGESTLYAKPGFQTIGIQGMPADNKRDQPDVSLFAGNGFWGHFLLLCMSDTNQGGTACDYTQEGAVFGNAAGGTSFATPAFAGIAALIVQKNGPVGNTAPRLYALAKAQFANAALSGQCNSSRGQKAVNACVFYTVTAGDNAEPCVAGSTDCFSTAHATSGVGVLRGSDLAGRNAYPAGNGYSLATGLGSVNVENLVGAY